jgi:uncharacterized protein YdbL (DUF1318 family)
MKPKYMPEYRLAIADSVFHEGDLIDMFGLPAEVVGVRYDTITDGEHYDEVGEILSGYFYLLRFKDGSEDEFLEEDINNAPKLAQQRTAQVYYLKDYSAWYSWGDGTWDSFAPGTHDVLQAHIPNPPVEAYEFIAQVSVDGATPLHDCEQMFELFNIGQRPVPVRSMSVGDIVVTQGQAFICADMGFKPAPWFTEGKTAQDESGIYQAGDPCWVCGGTGTLRDHECHVCNGTKVMTQEQADDLTEEGEQEIEFESRVSSVEDRFNTSATDWLGKVAAQVETESSISNAELEVKTFLDTLSVDQLSSRDATLHAARSLVSRTRTGRYIDTAAFLKDVEAARRMRYAKYATVSTKHEVEELTEVPTESLYT